MKKKFDSTAFARTAMLSALAIILSFIEGMLPELPVPGAKLGLANLAVMTSIDVDGIGGGACTALFKAMFALFTRGPVAGIMSLSGSILSTVVMWLILKYDRQRFGYVGVGVLGAVAHNMGQIAVAVIITGSAVLYYIPFLIIVGIVTGSVTGVVVSIILPILKKVQTYTIKN